MSDDVVPGWPQCRWARTDKVRPDHEMVGLLDVPPPLAVIKVHSFGLNWWLGLDMPKTWEIACGSTQNAEGRHYIYEMAEGVDIPLASIQDIIVDTVTRHFTGVPPSFNKTWVRKVKPTKLDFFPEVPESINGVRILGTHTPQMAKYGTHLIN